AVMSCLHAHAGSAPSPPSEHVTATAWNVCGGLVSVIFIIAIILIVYVDECLSSPCHAHADCSNGPGSFRCECRPGFHGDGFRCSPDGPPERPTTPCEHHRDSVQQGPVDPRGARPSTGHFVPQCDEEVRRLHRPVLVCGQQRAGESWNQDSTWCPAHRLRPT
ncbi:hypothetical protein CRUP_006557, partial [Coryphaenoides rupestris]